MSEHDDLYDNNDAPRMIGHYDAHASEIWKDTRTCAFGALYMSEDYDAYDAPLALIGRDTPDGLAAFAALTYSAN